MKTFNVLFIVIVTAAISAYSTYAYNKSSTPEQSEKKAVADQAILANRSLATINPLQSVSSPFIPEKITFAEKIIEQNNIDFHERLDKEIIVNMYRHSSTLIFLKKSKKYFEIIEPILKKNGIPDDFKYLAVIESGLENVVSPANASGIWQFMESTGKSYDLEINKFVDDRYHLEKSTEAACNYLKDVNRVYNDWILSAAAYNRGQGGISNALEDQDVDNYFELYLNSETARYVFRILAVKLIMESPEKYGFILNPTDYYPQEKTKTIEVDYAIEDLKAFAIEKGSNYKTLKLLNPWLQSSSLPKGKQTYKIKIPQID